MKACIQGIGLLGPGLGSWAEGQAVLRGNVAHTPLRTVLKAPARLPSTERRRAGDAIKLAMAVADEALAQGGLDPRSVATVFASSSGEGSNCHAICEALAGGDRLLSPTRFTNSVHNAPAGYWHIATGSRTASNSVCAFDDSFAAGLLEALTQLHATQAPVLLVASDTPYPEPLNAKRPLPDSFGLALLLAPMPSQRDPYCRRSLATLNVRLDAAVQARPSACRGASLEWLRAQLPAARALPLLQHLAGGDVDAPIVLPYRMGSMLHITVEPGRQA